MKTKLEESLRFFFAFGVALWLVVAPVPAQSPPQLSVQVSKGYARLIIVGEVGTACTIQCLTTNLYETSNWQFLTNLTPLSSSPYPVLDTSASPVSRFYRAFAQQVPTDVVAGPNMVWISPGTFVMGSPADDPDGRPSEGPQTTVTITRGFWMGKHEVTQGEYEAVMTNNPSWFQPPNATVDANRPVEMVNWYNATNYCAMLTQRERAAGRIATNWVYRLPTEAEWEYGCRAGTSTRFSYGDDPDYSSLADYAWYADNSSSMTHAVGHKLPNPWGLYDMYGNVYEWCQDWGATNLPGGVAVDPQGPATGTDRVIRGGDWNSFAVGCRSGFRSDDDPDDGDDDIGFRVVLAPVVPTNMALIPAGSFTMGNCMDPAEGDSRELPLHTVSVSGFYMDQYEVTKAHWDEVYQWAIANGFSFDNAGSGKAENHPVQTVNWWDTVKWCNARSEKEGRTPAYYTSLEQTNVYRVGQTDVQNDWVKWDAGYRLPTEAEWEKAARGGASGHRFAWSDAETVTHGRANYYSTNKYPYDISPTPGHHPTFEAGDVPYTSPVGSFDANGSGLYDMVGNVREWCWDWLDPYPFDAQTDPHGPATGSERVFRGGGWDHDAFRCRSAYRGQDPPGDWSDSHGFRTVLPACTLAPVPYTHTTNNGTITITGYTGPGGDVTIPSTINCLPVTSIGPHAFQSCFSLTNVTIPGSVTSIGPHAFNSCTSLVSVTIPNSVNTIGSWAFVQCTRLTSVTIPDSVTSMGSYAFQFCSNLASVIIGNSVTNIGDSVFHLCTSLAGVTIPSSVTRIGPHAFQSCFSLTNVTIPNSVTIIEENAFQECTSMTSVTIGNGVTSLGAHAFHDCSNLTSVIIGNRVTSIGDSVFYRCTSLTGVTIPGSVISIGPHAFHSCTSLTSVTIPDSVTRIEDWAFVDCTSLASVTIGNGATSIGNYAFQFCANLMGVYFKGNAPSVGSSAFDGDDSATFYYLPGTTGWGPTFGGLQTEPWALSNPLILNNAPSFGVGTNGFGFIISWATNITVVVEACTNLANPTWVPVSTNTLTNGSSYFSDPEGTNYSQRFYRVAGPPPPGGMAVIAGGSFTMGDTFSEGSANELPLHNVHVSTFWMDRHEVSNEQMRHVLNWAITNDLVSADASTVMNKEGDRQVLLELSDDDCRIGFSSSSNRFFVKSGMENFPCAEVSWYGAQAYCSYKSDMEGLQRCINFADWTCNFTNNGYRLPTEAEWEKAARGGLIGHHFPWPSPGGHYANHISRTNANYFRSGDPFGAGDDPTTLSVSPVGYYDGHQVITNEAGQLMPGSDMANGYGLYDMAGNVYEWCWDWGDDNWYKNPQATDPDTPGPPPTATMEKVMRGGSWEEQTVELRCAARSFNNPDDTGNGIGFRSVRRY